jgi:hypothetical protein
MLGSRSKCFVPAPVPSSLYSHHAIGSFLNNSVLILSVGFFVVDTMYQGAICQVRDVGTWVARFIVFQCIRVAYVSGIHGDSR